MATVEPVQVQWIDDLLMQWGAWVRAEDLRASPPCMLGRMYKQKMKELRIWDAPVQASIVSGMDADMLRVDRAIASLRPRERSVIKMRYWYSWPVTQIADRVRRSERTAYRWIVAAQQDLEIALRVDA
jgi:DNA-directed RNA polymerase specialized sigma24 family protein